MTNGEKIKEIFPSTDSRLDEKTGIMLVKWADGTTKCFKADWWNAEYIEPKQKMFDYLTAVGQGMIEGEKVSDDEWVKAINAIETNCKWEEAIEKIKADINDGINETASLIEVAKANANFFAEEELGRLKSILNDVQGVIDKHTKELI